MTDISDLGARLRDLRRERDLTLAAIANDTGFTVGYLSQIENGLATPSLTALAVIAASLGSEMAAFFPEEPTADVRVTRSADPERFRIAPDEHADYELLNGRIHEGQFSVLIATHRPDGRAPEFRHAGEEHAIVLEGALEFEIDGVRRRVDAGQWVHYSSESNHAATVLSDAPARVLWVLHPGIF